MPIMKTHVHPLRLCLAHALPILPAAALGVIAMMVGGVSSALWGQQVAAFVVFALLGLFPSANKKGSAPILSALMLLILAAALFSPSVGGAKRWLSLGLFNIHTGALVLPSLLILLSGMHCIYPALICSAALLCLQPDLSQLAAFALGALPLLWQRRKQIRWQIVSVLLLGVFLFRCAVTPTTLEPVAYCEGILPMLGGLSPLLQAAGYLALGLIPTHFLCRFLRFHATGDLCLALYYAAGFLASLTGQVPVPFMGFGLSPIAGYHLAACFIPKEQAPLHSPHQKHTGDYVA